MTRVAVAADFGWDTFSARYWNRQPVLFKGIQPVPFVEDEVFHAAVVAAPNSQFTVEEMRQAFPNGYLPTETDLSFDGYERRVNARLGGRGYALIVNGFHTVDYSLWSREREFFLPLWEQIGLPLSGAITTLFHGNYEHSPVGVHKDRFATFMFVLRGRKRMRFWPNRPWQEPVTTLVSYHDYLPGSFAIDADAGDLLYWPSSYYHVGENVGSQPSTSVNIGLPCEEYRVVYALNDLLTDPSPDVVLDPDGQFVAGLPPTTASALAPPPNADQTLPESFSQALCTIHQRLTEQADRLTMASLRKWTVGGFEPVPAPAPARPLADDDVVRGQGIGYADGVCAANGHAVRTDVDPDTLELLSSGQPIRAGDLPPAARRLLEQLGTFGAIRYDRFTG